MVGSPLFHSLCLSNKRQNFLPPVAVAQWSWQSPHSTVFIIIIAQTPVYGNSVLQKYKGRLPGGICRPLQLPEYYNIPGKLHGRAMLAPTSEGQIRANRPFARRGGVTPPYGAIKLPPLQMYPQGFLWRQVAGGARPARGQMVAQKSQVGL